MSLFNNAKITNETTYHILDPYNTQYVDGIHQSYRMDFDDKMRAMADEVIKAREYYDGTQDTMLTDRTKKYLNLENDADFTVNYCPLVVNAKADRLTVTGFDTEDTQKDILTDWWRKNRMDRKQGIVHRAALRDGNAYMLVEWDETADMPRFYFEPAYAGDGVCVYYSDERRDEIEFASKYWRINRGSQMGKVRRLNLYFPDRIEKYISNDDNELGNYLPFEDDTTDIVQPGYLGNAGVSWWTDNREENGDPLGIPIVHFKHDDSGDHYGTSHLAKVMPLQDALNKAMIDLMGAMDVAGFGLLVGYGTNSWTSVKVGPGAIAAVSTPPDQAKLERLPAENPQGLLSVYNALVMEIARISGTPLSYFQTSGQVAAEGTMKQQEIALIAQVEKSQVDFGNSWEDVLAIGRRLHNAFGSGEALDEDEIIDTIWKEAETRNDKEQAETLALKVEKLGISEDQAQIELGYDATQRAAFARDKLRKRALAVRAGPFLQTNTMNGNNQQDQTLTQTENEAGNNDTGRTQAA